MRKAGPGWTPLRYEYETYQQICLTRYATSWVSSQNAWPPLMYEYEYVWPLLKYEYECGWPPFNYEYEYTWPPVMHEYDLWICFATSQVWTWMWLTTSQVPPHNHGRGQSQNMHLGERGGIKKNCFFSEKLRIQNFLIRKNWDFFGICFQKGGGGVSPIPKGCYHKNWGFLDIFTKRGGFTQYIGIL